MVKLFFPYLANQNNKNLPNSTELQKLDQFSSEITFALLESFLT